MVRRALAVAALVISTSCADVNQSTFPDRRAAAAAEVHVGSTAEDVLRDLGRPDSFDRQMIDGHEVVTLVYDINDSRFKYIFTDIVVTWVSRSESQRAIRARRRAAFVGAMNDFAKALGEAAAEIEPLQTSSTPAPCPAESVGVGWVQQDVIRCLGQPSAILNGASYTSGCLHPEATFVYYRNGWTYLYRFNSGVVAERLVRYYIDASLPNAGGRGTVIVPKRGRTVIIVPP
jgi:hypothetical protein